MTSSQAATATGGQDRAALDRAMAEQGLAALWKVYDKLVTKEPAGAVPSHIWRWRDLAPLVEMAAASVTGHDADHRVLVLTNPHLQGRFASVTNIVGAVQCVLPGERTSPHRHTPAAVRIVFEGRGGGTFVDGQRCDMYDGDLIVTPNWTWHCHDNDSQARAVWLDILDVPMVKAFDNIFGDKGPPADYPVNLSTLPDPLFAAGGLLPVTDRPAVPYTTRFRYPWRDVVAVLASLPQAADGTRMMRYANPADGGPVTPTLDAYVIELAPGRASTKVRSSAGTLAVVVEGSGESTIGAVTQRWQTHDVFTLPEWQWVSHKAEGGPARLILITDREVRRRLGLLREERGGPDAA
jgi:gentisate 1,2-dioxygenase